MDATQLREIQTPLKQQYKTDPESARTPLGAHGEFADVGITATVQSWPGPVRAGLHRATGGDGRDACSGDMLMEALLACAGVTLRSVATAMGVEIRGARQSLQQPPRICVTRRPRPRPNRSHRVPRGVHVATGGQGIGSTFVELLVTHLGEVALDQGLREQPGLVAREYPVRRRRRRHLPAVHHDVAASLADLHRTGQRRVS